MLTIEQLLSVVTLTSARQTMITLAQSLGFKGAFSWQAGSLERTLGIEVPALLLADGSRTSVLVARGGYNDTAEGSWLDLYALSAYANLRNEAVRAYGTATLYSEATDATDIEADYVVASNANGVTFRNKTGGTLPAGGELNVEFEAEVAGAAGNIPVGTLRELKTSLAGVTINNPGADGIWLTRYGADRETDVELRERNRTRWATRAYAAPEEAYENWAREANPTIKRALADGQRQLDGAGSVHIYIAGDAGALDGAVCTDVVEYITGVTDGIVRRPLGANVFCTSAAEHVVNVTGTIYYAAAYNGTALHTLAVNALTTFFQAIPIGGTLGGQDALGQVLFSQLYATVMSIPGVVNMTLSAPLDDEELNPEEVAVPAISLMMSPI